MAFGGCPKDNFTKDLMKIKKNSVFGENSGEKESHTSYFQNNKKLEFMEIPKKKYCDCLNFATSRKSDEFKDRNALDKDDTLTTTSESLSSSASISDSDITSTDSEDSLALSESESITDVTPLNSPYCDSPLPQSKHSDHKNEDLSSLYATQNNEVGGSSCDHSHPEANVLMKAIEKIELEAKCKSSIDGQGNVNKLKTPFSSEEIKKMDPDNKLFKRVISQNQMKSVYASSDQSGRKPFPCRREEIKSDMNTSSAYKKLMTGKLLKDGSRPSVHRKQKCFSHPSSFVHTCQHLSEKKIFTSEACNNSSTVDKVVPDSDLKDDYALKDDI